MTTIPSNPCNIVQVGRQRSGKPRYWCTAHRASATGKYGKRLTECEFAYRDIGANTKIIDPSEYPGGVALWGAVCAAYDTTDFPSSYGIHTHARLTVDGEKEIDETFDEVHIIDSYDLFRTRHIRISSKDAISYFISQTAGYDLEYLDCTHCRELHLDAEQFAVTPHRKHLCHSCGREFIKPTRSISNPIAYIRKLYPLPEVQRPDRPLSIRQTDYPGGIKIWASNPAIIWTGPRTQDAGIHVHAFSNKDPNSPRAEDETFSEVEIDGYSIDEKQLRLFMAQNSLEYLDNKIVSLTCPKCSTPLTEEGQAAFIPSRDKVCPECGNQFTSTTQRKLVVSNPIIDTFDKLRKSLLR